MVKKLEEQSPTMDVGIYLKRSSSFDDCAIEAEVDAHSSKKARERTPEESLISQKPNKQKKNSNKQERKSRVRFSSKNEVIEIAPRTREEKLEMHMTKEEQRLIMQEITEAVRRFDRHNLKQQVGGEDSENTVISELGIERILQQQEVTRIIRVRNAKIAILQRQRQIKIFKRSKLFCGPTEQTKTIDENWLEKYYRPFSKISSELAHSRGLEDQEMAPYLTPRQMIMSR